MNSDYFLDTKASLDWGFRVSEKVITKPMFHLKPLSDAIISIKLLGLVSSNDDDDDFVQNINYYQKISTSLKLTFAK